MVKFKEIDITRIASVILIVLLHSFAIYTGAWEPPVKFQAIEIYKWIGLLFSSVAVPSFVFISGFLFKYQIEQKKWTFIEFITKKAKRLLLPAIIFGTLYLLLYNKTYKFSDILEVLNGVAHLWFLPMLFWCFVVSFFLFRLPDKYSLLIAFLFLFIGGGYLPFCISRMFYYLIYFVVGGIFYSHKVVVKMTSRKQILVGCLFIILWIVGLLLKRFSDPSLNEMETLLMNRGFHVLRAIYGIAGVIVLFSLAYRLRNKSLHFISPLTRLSFGIYIYHQFILVFLYYKTPLSELVGGYWLPIVGFLLALILSIILSQLTLKTRFGRYLIE
ncbi:acyltransferase family protein [Limibacterium fermenti]|uniref:acyltransferase family protein n=1 Tax=Limibacterium fermenti TaxID=3229863 RepID=UPI003A774718